MVSQFLKKTPVNAKIMLDKAAAIIRANPEPKLEKLCLKSLPPEMLYHIMEAMDIDEARILGATCRQLHRIS